MVAVIFIDEKTVSLKLIEEGSFVSKSGLEIRSLKWPFSATLMSDDPEIPPCQGRDSQAFRPDGPRPARSCPKACGASPKPALPR